MTSPTFSGFINTEDNLFKHTSIGYTCTSFHSNDVLDPRLNVAAEIPVVLLSDVRRHQQLDVVPNRLLLGVPKCLGTFVVLLSDPLPINLLICELIHKHGTDEQQPHAIARIGHAVPSSGETKDTG